MDHFIDVFCQSACFPLPYYFLTGLASNVTEIVTFHWGLCRDPTCLAQSQEPLDLAQDTKSIEKTTALKQIVWRYFFFFRWRYEVTISSWRITFWPPSLPFLTYCTNSWSYPWFPQASSETPYFQKRSTCISLWSFPFSLKVYLDIHICMFIF